MGVTENNLLAQLSTLREPENNCAPPAPDFAARVQASETSKLTDITLDDIRIAQGADDCLQPIIKALEDCAQPPHSDMRQYPEETRILHIQPVHGYPIHGQVVYEDRQRR